MALSTLQQWAWYVNEALILMHAAGLATVQISAAYLKPYLLIPTRMPILEHNHITGC